MSDAAQLPPSPLQALGRNWVTVGSMCLVAGGIGAAIGWNLPVTYTAETIVSVGHDDLSAHAQPGYALATQQLASNYSRNITNNDNIKKKYQDSDDAMIAASPIPDSNKIRIEAFSKDPQTSERVATAVADELMQQINDERASVQMPAVRTEIDRLTGEHAKLEQEVTKLENQLNRLVGQNASEAKRAPLHDQIAAARQASKSKEVELQGQVSRYQELQRTSHREAELWQIGEAQVTSSSQKSAMQQGIAGGIGVAGLLGLMFAMRKEKARFVPNNPLTGAMQRITPALPSSPMTPLPADRHANLVPEPIEAGPSHPVRLPLHSAPTVVNSVTTMAGPGPVPGAGPSASRAAGAPVGQGTPGTGGPGAPPSYGPTGSARPTDSDRLSGAGRPASSMVNGSGRPPSGSRGDSRDRSAPSADRSTYSADRTVPSADRSTYSADRSGSSVEPQHRSVPAAMSVPMVPPASPPYGKSAAEPMPSSPPSGSTTPSTGGRHASGAQRPQRVSRLPGAGATPANGQPAGSDATGGVTNRVTPTVDGPTAAYPPGVAPAGPPVGSAANGSGSPSSSPNGGRSHGSTVPDSSANGSARRSARRAPEDLVPMAAHAQAVKTATPPEGEQPAAARPRRVSDFSSRK